LFAKPGIASMAQLNQFDVPANVTTYNTATLNVTIKKNDDSKQPFHKVIRLSDKNKHKEKAPAAASTLCIFS